MNIGIVGNRTGWSYNFVRKKLKELGVSKSDTIITGGATGVDTFAHRYAIEIGAGIRVIYPNTNESIPQRYFNRNKKIVSQSDMIIAFNKYNNPRTGTQNTVNYANKISKKVIVIDKEDEMKITLEGKTLDSLQSWLLSREEDIADGWEDFGELQHTFEKVVGWKARSVTE